MEKIHLDTDLGGDLDDLCALALLLRWPDGVALTGVTTVGDTGGRRAGYARYVLRLEGMEDVPVAAGADTAEGYYPYPLGLPDETRYWPEPVEPAPGPAAGAVELLRHSLEQGAAIVGIGPQTNLYLLDQRYPGILKQARLCLMGGWVFPPRPGYPPWGYDMDFNVQVDVRSARHVLQQADPTLVPLAVTVETALRRAYLDDLRRAGALGQLIARQAEAFALDEQMETRFGQTCAALPRDILNFQHDSLACAVALGWPGAKVEELPLTLEQEGAWLVERVDPAGKLVRVATAVDGESFNELWRQVVARPGAGSAV